MSVFATGLKFTKLLQFVTTAVCSVLRTKDVHTSLCFGYVHFRDRRAQTNTDAFVYVVLPIHGRRDRPRCRRDGFKI